MNPQVSALCFVRRFGLFFSCLFFISLFHRKLEWLGLQCRPQLAADPGARPPFDVTQTDSRPDRQVQESSVTVIWAETLITTGACFLLAQGFFGVRAARERMERVRHTATNLAYSFLKATKATTDTVHGREQLELLVYECLALLTAFPIALLEDARGNTCEPAVTRYCRDVAKTLKRLRSGDDAIVTGPVSSCESSSMAGGQNRPRYVTVDYFFELFSLQLLLEFRRQGLRVKLPSIAPQHILYKLRNHFENMVDSRNIDDRRTPIIRENIDMLGLAGRECGIFGMADIVPITFLWSVWVAGWIIAVYNPIRMCSMVVAWVPPQVQDTDSVVFPPFRTMLPMAGLSVLSAVVTAMMAEMWRMWDPFNAGINCYGWTQGIAMEIDAMLNEFSEYDADELVRPHAYMTPAYRGSSPPRGLVPGPLLAPSPLMDDEELGGSETPEDMAQTV
ncbi:hypothetical protein CDD83_1824 [Cordyceps sp. RAO-2017]|nr:hypothetical protein CDD83_1824 [Cordyceps sp. RAO-2017]